MRILAIVATLLISPTIIAEPGLINHEEAIEAAAVVAKDGRVRFKRCPTCRGETMRTAQNVVVSRTGASRLPPIMPGTATIFYRKADELVTRIKYWQR